MFTSFEQLVNNVKPKAATAKKLNKMALELNRDIVESLKNVDDKQLRKELNKDRIKALGLKLIQGGKA